MYNILNSEVEKMYDIGEIPEDIKDEMRDLLIEAEEDAIRYQMRSQVWYDKKTKDTWLTHFFQNETYMKTENTRGYYLVADIEPHTIFDIYSEDQIGNELKEDPEKFWEWYLHSGEGFQPYEIIDYFEKFGAATVG